MSKYTPVEFTRPWPVQPVDDALLVSVPADSVTAARLRAINAPGVVPVVKFATDADDLDGAAAGVMAGLGKQVVLAFSKRPTRPLATAWLAAASIHTAVIVDPQDYPTKARDQIIDWFAAQGVRTILAWPDSNGTGPRTEAAALDIAAFWAMVEADEPSVAPAADSRLPRLPRVDGLVFRSACAELLAPDDAARVDAEFCALVADIRERVRANAKPVFVTDSRLLRKLIDYAPDTEELILTVRAAQVAYLLEGRHVAVSTAALLGAAESLPRRGFSVSQNWWERLGAYWDPDVPAAVALHHAEFTADDLCALTLSSVTPTAPDDITVAVDRGEDNEAHQAQLLGPSARYVAALYLFRLACGAGPDERLFVTHRSGKIARKFASDRLLRDPRDEVGVWAHYRLDRRNAKDQYWLDRYGVAITKLHKET